MNLKQLSSRSLAVIVSALLCNAPQYLVAQSAAVPAPQTSVQEPQNGSTLPDPSQAPLAPVPSARPADNNATPPDAPSEVQRSQQQTQPETTTSEAQPEQQHPAIPLGTATAQQGATRGGLASRPAGEAIAPAKQRQVHSLLIKVGLLAAGAAAIGTVVGLTRSTSNLPPGAH